MILLLLIFNELLLNIDPVEIDISAFYFHFQLIFSLSECLRIKLDF